MEQEGEEKKNTAGKILVILIALFMLGLILIYWLFPTNVISFNFDTNSNFSIEAEEMQFYPNMRFLSSTISYTIEEECSLQKKQDMETGFEIMESSTMLEFISSEKGMISVYCEKRGRIEGSEKGFFIAGEGGPVNVTMGKYFNVIHGGEIILIKNSNCAKPNIAIHELLHVLGFNHSDNSNNILYPVSNCKQTISPDIIEKIDELYSYPSLPELEFEKVSAQMKGRSLDLNITIKNHGLKDSDEFNIIVYGDGKKIKTIESEGIEVGYAQKIIITNSLITKLKINELKFFIEANFEELSKTNNEIVLNVLE